MLSHTPGFNVKVSRMSIGHSWGTRVKRSHVIKKKKGHWHIKRSSLDHGLALFCIVFQFVRFEK